MTTFQFPESSFSFKIDKFKTSKKQNQELNDIFIGENSSEIYVEKSDFTVHLEDFLDNLIKNNIQFELPPKIEIKYYNYNDWDKFKDNLKDFGQKFTQKLPFSMGIFRKEVFISCKYGLFKWYNSYM